MRAQWPEVEVGHLMLFLEATWASWIFQSETMVGDIELASPLVLYCSPLFFWDGFGAAFEEIPARKPQKKKDVRWGGPADTRHFISFDSVIGAEVEVLMHKARSCRGRQGFYNDGGCQIVSF